MPTAEDTDNKQLSFDLFGLDLNRATHNRADQTTNSGIISKPNNAIRYSEGCITLSGPHRDELRMFINDRDCGLYGSRGQARTTVMALKFAELQWMCDSIGEYPLFLLDEVVAELDSKRRAFLLERLDGKAQTIVTTTELDIFSDEFIQRAQVLNVINGQIEPAELS